MSIPYFRKKKEKCHSCRQINLKKAPFKKPVADDNRKYLFLFFLRKY